MPLTKSASKKAVGKNIATEMKKHPDMPQKQAVAIAMSTQRKAKGYGAMPKRKMMK